jgi:hopanoid-associated phosphorylase
MAGRRVIAVCGLRFEAAIAAGPDVAAVHALGIGRLGALAETMLSARGEYLGVISFGCAGGLDPGLAPGDCILAEAVESPSGLLRSDPAWLGALRARLDIARLGLLAGVIAPVTTAAQKARLRTETGALAVDMESYAAAQIARLHGLPFVALRVVVDTAEQSLPPCATAGLQGDGSAALLPVLRSLASSPGQLPALINLAAHAFAARRTLRSARTRAGPLFALPA